MTSRIVDDQTLSVSQKELLTDLLENACENGFYKFHNMRPDGDPEFADGSECDFGWVFNSFRLSHDRRRGAVVITGWPLKVVSPITQNEAMTILGLTKAEASIAVRLARGKTLKSAAEALGVSQSSARALLSRVLQKTGTSRQNELVAFLWLLAPL